MSELQQNCQQQEDRHRELTQELQTLRSAAGKNNFKHPPNHSPSHHRELANHSPSHLPNHSSPHHKDSSNQKSLTVAHPCSVEGTFCIINLSHENLVVSNDLENDFVSIDLMTFFFYYRKLSSIKCRFPD